YQGKKDKDATALATGMLGIFALLIAFTYSLALSRYDARKTLVVNEANAITTAAGYAQMLPREFALPSVSLLHRYSILRRDLVAPYEPDLFATQISQSAAIRGKLWSLAVQTGKANPASLALHRFAQALSDMNNIAEKREMALRNHVPAIVLWLLVITAVVSLGFAGYSAGESRMNRYVGLTVMACLIAILIGLTLELDRPQRGEIQTSGTPLIKAVKSLDQMTRAGGSDPPSPSADASKPH